MKQFETEAIKKMSIPKGCNIRMAMQAINRGEMGVAFVVEGKTATFDTLITDGDIRRGLIKQLSTNEKLSKFMSKNPVSALLGDSKESMLIKMKRLDILQIPIVDNNGVIVGLETLRHLTKKHTFDNTVFLMAGGYGKRLSPLTDSMPKPLLKIGSKPILENILNNFISSGFHNFYISTYYKGEMLQEYFGDGSNWGVKIKYVHEDTPLGTAGSLRLLPKESLKLPILVMNGDLLTNVDFKELLYFHMQGKNDATMCVREYDFQVPYGVVRSNKGYVSAIEEKPIHQFFINAGIYVINPSILDTIEGNGCLDMPELLEKKIEESVRVGMFPVHEYWLDIGQLDQFKQAQKDVTNLYND